MFNSYSEVYHNCSSDFIIEKRLDLVHYANTFGIKAAARYFSCSKNTIKRWLRRYAVYGKPGLANKSRAPKRVYRKISDNTINEIKNTVEDCQNKKKYITTVNIMRKLNLESLNYFTINRYVQKFKRKRQKREVDSSLNSSLDFKKKLRPFELIQVDIKYLTDIDQLRPYFYDRNLCKYQITARDVCSGYTFVAYSFEKSSTCTKLFLKKIYSFLSTLEGLNLRESVSIQSDNGKEFTNRDTRVYNKPVAIESAFTKFVNENFCKHRLIILGHCKSQSEVESFHWIIERDCLSWEDIVDNDSLIKYTSIFLQNFNSKKRFKCNYSPIEKISSYFDIKNIKFPDPIIL